MSEYDIYKDAKPIETIKKIKNILSSNMINVEEIDTSKDDEKRKLCPSLRIRINGTHIGTNGKGTSYKKALASGYAEFMERLQNGTLVSFIPSDQKLINKSEVSSKILDFFPLDIISDKVSVTPFYSLKEKEVVDLPICLIQSTNGFSAGNSYEEALVQGISEICERYVLDIILKNKVTIPLYNKDSYMKYQKIKKIVDLYESNNWEVYIKDASLGLSLPVIFAVFLNKKYNIMCLSFGAHPSFPNAVERTLTEAFQGLDIKVSKDIKNTNQSFISSLYYEQYLKDNPDAFLDRIIQGKLYFEINEDLVSHFLNNSESVIPSSDMWILQKSNATNKDLLKFLLKKIEHITKNDIYVRDVSFMGFPSFRTYIPNMSNVCQIRAEDYEKYLFWLNYSGNDNHKLCTIQNLLTSIESTNNKTILPNLSKFPNEYIAFLTSIVLQDYKRIVKYSDFLLKKNIENEYIIKMVKRYFELKNMDLGETSINESLLNEFGIINFNKFIPFIKNLSFDVIKVIIKNNKRKIVNEEQLKMIEVRLKNLFHNNCPNQMDLFYIFNSIM